MPTQRVFIPSIYDRTPLETIISYNPRQSGDPSEVTEVIGVVLTHPYAPLGEYACQSPCTVIGKENKKMKWLTSGIMDFMP